MGGVAVSERWSLSQEPASEYKLSNIIKAGTPEGLGNE